MAPETYEGPREYDAMSEFAKTHISMPICSAFRPDNCSPEDIKVLEELKTKSKSELEAMASATEALVSEAEKAFDVEVEKLQKQYDEFVDGFNSKLDKIKTDAHYKFVEQTLVAISKAEAEAAEGAGDEL
jgi:hypothetical protein